VTIAKRIVGVFGISLLMLMSLVMLALAFVLIHDGMAPGNSVG